MTDNDDNAMPAITTSETALMWHPFNHTVRMLMAANAVRANGLYLIRTELKDGSWHGMPPSIEGQRLLLLADVCTALSIVEHIPLDYFRAQGDVPEASPDDLSGIA